ncbi:elongation of very long chain fatty acids protein AAEL008004 [Caerostris darwini]|uniref:Elongation of very long chain fatty acids protein n=1 Tax=Caerostris darwini TaxID=1538125 RepID=A0AAV4Q3R7_9ARAC|nr:elongation of very long chain fatty acids protein AAEL008004 [Caerostris darwini]
MTPDYEYVLKYGDPRVTVYPLMDSPVKLLILIAIYFVLVRFVGPMWMENRPPYNFRSAMIVYNLSISALSMWLFLNFGVYGWFTKYKLRCEPVDYSSNEDALKMVQICWVFFASKLLEFADTIFAVLRKKYSFVTKIHLFHHCASPVAYWYCVKYGPGGYTTLFMFLNSFVHSNLYLYYCLAVIGIKTEKHLWWKTYIKISQLIQFVITLVYCFQLYFFAPDNCKVSPFLLRLHLCLCSVFFILNLHAYRQIKDEGRITGKKTIKERN